MPNIALKINGMYVNRRGEIVEIISDAKRSGWYMGRYVEGPRRDDPRCHRSWRANGSYWENQTSLSDLIYEIKQRPVADGYEQIRESFPEIVKRLDAQGCDYSAPALVARIANQAATIKDQAAQLKAAGAQINELSVAAHDLRMVVSRQSVKAAEVAPESIHAQAEVKITRPPAPAALAQAQEIVAFHKKLEDQRKAAAEAAAFELTQKVNEIVGGRFNELGAQLAALRGSPAYGTTLITRVTNLESGHAATNRFVDDWAKVIRQHKGETAITAALVDEVNRRLSDFETKLKKAMKK